MIAGVDLVVLVSTTLFMSVLARRSLNKASVKSQRQWH
jgi:hypothetical protein